MNSSTIQIEFNDLKPLIDLFEPDTMEALYKVIESGQYILGKEVECFEVEFAQYCKRQFCVGVASGSDAITLALMAYGIGPKDSVITVANSAPATVTAIRKTGASIRYLDVDENGLIDVKLLTKSCILDGVRAIVPVDLYGQCSDTPSIMSAIRDRGIYIIEDCCQAHGSRDKTGFIAGAWSDVACYSFYPTKNLGCIGDGGAITTDDPKIAKRIAKLRHYGLEGPNQDEHGMNSRLDELQASILRVRLKRLEEINEYRRGIASVYSKRLGNIKYFSVPEYKKTNNYHLYVVKTEDRDQLRNWLASKGIKTAIHYQIPSYKQTSEVGFYRGMVRTLENTEKHCNQILSLPIWYGMPLESVDYVCQKIKEFFHALN